MILIEFLLELRLLGSGMGSEWTENCHKTPTVSGDDSLSARDMQGPAFFHQSAFRGMPTQSNPPAQHQAACAEETIFP